MVKRLLWTLLLAFQLLNVSASENDHHPTAVAKLATLGDVANDIDDFLISKPNSDKRSERLRKKHVEESLNEILDYEHEYMDEEDDVVLWKAVVTSLAEWNYLKLLKHNSTRQKREKEPICYQDVGCFANDGPYSHLSLPTSPDEIGTKFFLYTRAKEEPDLVSYMNVTSLKASGFNATHSVKVIIHGFGSSCRRVWAKEMRLALMSVDHSNVICVDWEKGAALPNYPRATSNTRLVGRQVANLVNKVHEVFGTNNSAVHLIGFSLGAHVAGYAGAELRNVSRITGLDPAGPMFENQDAVARLDKTDGTFVDVIHSNGESLIMGGLGAWTPMGHIDFYPNGGRMQKGCTNLFLGAVTDIIFSSTPGDGRSLCNHRRAYKFFTDSVVPGCLFPAFPCDDYDKFLTGECFPCTDDKCGNMGYYANQSPGRGIMYLATREEEPFCANQFRVMIYSSYNFPEAVSRGKLEIMFFGDNAYNETFYMTKGPDVELRSGDRLVRMVVAHILLEQPYKIRLIYTAYNGWISSGLPYWSIDKVVITDSFGKNTSYCQTGLVLPTGVSTTITLNQGDCIPLTYDVYAPNRDQIWKIPDINSKVVPLSGDFSFNDPKLQVLGPASARYLANNGTHRFFDANNTAAVYPYGPVPISVIQQHIPANIKVSGRKPLIPSLRFISSLQRHFRSKSKGPPSPSHPSGLRTDFYPPPLPRPVQELPLDYKDVSGLPREQTNHTVELYQGTRPIGQVPPARTPVRGELAAPWAEPLAPRPEQLLPQQLPREPPGYDRRPQETVYVHAPGEAAMKGNLPDYVNREPSTNIEKMNGRREITNKHLGQGENILVYSSDLPESSSVTYSLNPSRYEIPSEVPNYPQNYQYRPENNPSGMLNLEDYPPRNYDAPNPYLGYEAVGENQDYVDSKDGAYYARPEDVHGSNSENLQKYEGLSEDLIHNLQTEETLVYRQTDGSVKVLFMPNKTSEYDDQLVSYTERDDVLGGDPEFEYQYYDDYDEDVSGTQLLKNDRLEAANAPTESPDPKGQANRRSDVLLASGLSYGHQPDKQILGIATAENRSDLGVGNLSVGGDILPPGSPIPETVKLSYAEAPIGVIDIVDAKQEPKTLLNPVESDSQSSPDNLSSSIEKKLPGIKAGSEFKQSVSASNHTEVPQTSKVRLSPSFSPASTLPPMNSTKAAAEFSNSPSVAPPTPTDRPKPSVPEWRARGGTPPKEISKPRLVTILASIESTTAVPPVVTAPPNATREPALVTADPFNDKSSLIAAQFINLSNSETRRGKRTRHGGNPAPVSFGNPTESVRRNADSPHIRRMDNSEAQFEPDAARVLAVSPPIALNAGQAAGVSAIAIEVARPTVSEVARPSVNANEMSRSSTAVANESSRPKSASPIGEQPKLANDQSAIGTVSRVQFNSRSKTTAVTPASTAWVPASTQSSAASDRGISTMKQKNLPNSIGKPAELTQSRSDGPKKTTDIRLVGVSETSQETLKSGATQIPPQITPNGNSSRGNSDTHIKSAETEDQIQTSQNRDDLVAVKPVEVGQGSAQIENRGTSLNPSEFRSVTPPSASINREIPSLPEPPKTLIKFSAQDRVTERSETPERKDRPYQFAPQELASAQLEVGSRVPLLEAQPPLPTSYFEYAAAPVAQELEVPRVRQGVERPVSSSVVDNKQPAGQATLPAFQVDAVYPSGLRMTPQDLVPPVRHATAEIAPIQAERRYSPGRRKKLKEQTILVDNPLAGEHLLEQPGSRDPAQHTVQEFPVPVQSDLSGGSQHEMLIDNRETKPVQTMQQSNPFGIPSERVAERNNPFGISNEKTWDKMSYFRAAPSVENPQPFPPPRREQTRRFTMVYNPNEPPSPGNPDSGFRPEEGIRGEAPTVFYEDLDRADHNKVRLYQDDGLVRIARLDDQQRHMVETAKVQTLSRDLMPPPIDTFGEPGSRRRSRLYRYSSWIPNIWSYINPFSGRQDEVDPKSTSNGWLSSIWSPQQVLPLGVPPPPVNLQPVLSSTLVRVPVRRDSVSRKRDRTIDTGENPELVAPVAA